MDGVINVLKPPGMSSSDVVTWMRRALNIKKIGHTGTLDPGVAGVLPLCVGKATRLAEYLTEQGKTYLAEITFGITTDTQDGYGTVIKSKPPRLAKPGFGQDHVLSILPKFTGKIEQIPPMYSAVKQRGKRLYEYARQGIEFERPAREVEIYSLTLIRWEEGEFPRAFLQVECSKGTYVRTLCHDLGEALGCGAYMSYLVRLQSGPFSIADSWTLEEIEESIHRKHLDFILPPSVGIHLPRVDLPKMRSNAFCNGLSTTSEKVIGEIKPDGTHVQVFADNELIGIGVWKDGKLYPYKVLR